MKVRVTLCDRIQQNSDDHRLCLCLQSYIHNRRGQFHRDYILQHSHKTYFASCKTISNLINHCMSKPGTTTIWSLILSSSNPVLRLSDLLSWAVHEEIRYRKTTFCSSFISVYNNVRVCKAAKQVTICNCIITLATVTNNSTNKWTQQLTCNTIIGLSIVGDRSCSVRQTLESQNDIDLGKIVAIVGILFFKQATQENEVLIIW